MNLQLGISIILYLNPAFLKAESEIDIWKLGKQFVEFSKDENAGTMLSSFCEHKECDARKALKNISFKNINTEALKGGKNPGAVLCHQMKEAHLVYLKDLQGNENTFCQFKDNSMASSSTLATFARRNDEK